MPEVKRGQGVHRSERIQINKPARARAPKLFTLLPKREGIQKLNSTTILRTKDATQDDNKGPGEALQRTYTRLGTQAVKQQVIFNSSNVT